MSKEQRERLPVSVSAAVFVEDDQGRLLLLRQAAEWKGKRWGPPAGGMHAHEDPMMNALREAKEEIGVEVELVDLIGIYTADRGNDATGIGFVFRGRITNGDIKIRQGEIIDHRFFSPAEIQDLIERDLIYKPEYNLPAIRDWVEGCYYPIEVVRPLDIAQSNNS